MIFPDWTFEYVCQIRYNLMQYSLCSSARLLHLEILLLELVQLPLKVEVLFFLHDLPLLGHSVILVKQSLGLVMNEIT